MEGFRCEGLSVAEPAFILQLSLKAGILFVADGRLQCNTRL